MFDEKDLQQIREHGLTPEQAETQLEISAADSLS